MKNILAENMLRFGTKNLSEQTKLILTEDISEFNNVTNAIQTSLDNFNTSAETAYGKGNVWVLKQTSKHFPRTDYQTFYWIIYITNPKTGSTASHSHVGHSTPNTFGKFWILRPGHEDAKERLIYKKIFQMNKSTTGHADATQLFDVCEYDANSGKAPTWADTNAALSNLATGFDTLAKDALDYTTDKHGNKLKPWDKTPMLNTSKALTEFGPNLVQNIKEVFNSLKLAPTTLEGKKSWKGMKTV
jgi:hypothetical protein